MKLTIIGDVHGKVHEYKKIIDKCEFSICVGDFGFEPEWNWLSKQINNNEEPWNHWINPGNHDYGPYMRYQINQSCGNFAYFDQFGIFTIRGAESIDKHLRIEGLDWFPNEELNYKEQLEAFDKYLEIRPKIVVSHDCPQSVMEKLFGYPEKSQTRTLLENMFQEHQPELWIFGHYHKSKDVQIEGTRFVCLSELELLKLNYDQVYL